MKKRTKKRAKKRAAFDKYALYAQAVQQPEEDVRFIQKTFRLLKRKTPKVLREDFCGTFKLCCEWVKLGPEHIAHGLDLSPEPTDYGKKHYLPKLSASRRSRVHIYSKNVLDPDAPSADVVLAQNFSYFIFKKRTALKRYFANCLNTLNEGGLLAMDCFGGSECQKPNVESTNNEGCRYYWDQTSFEPITNESRFSIHFKPPGGKKVMDVFTYDWRMWSIPEIRDLLDEVGFRKTHVYWQEGGADGDGEFTRAGTGDETEAWIAYIIAEK